MAKKKVETALILRTCAADMKSHSEFQWPSEVGAVVEAPDWIANNECGNGLHGWLFGQGDHECSNSVRDSDAKWLVVEAVLADVIALGGKVKFQRCTIRHIGDRKSATDFMLANEVRSAGVAIIGATRTARDKEHCQVGALGSATAGDYGTATAGYYGTATAGNSGTATAGNYGTATAGNSGTATAGDYGTATAGEKGEIRIKFWDKKSERYRTAQGYIGESGLEPNVAYKLNAKNKFVKA